MSRNVFILRAKPHGIDRENEFLAGTVSLGFPEIPDMTELSDAKIRSLALEKYNDQVLASIQLSTFRSVRVGDYIISPSPTNPQNVHFFEVTSDYWYRQDYQDDNLGNPHSLSVILLTTLQRSTLPPSIQTALQIARKSITEVSRLLPTIEALLSNTSISNNVDSRDKARAALESLLDSDNEEVRLRAALALFSEHSL